MRVFIGGDYAMSPEGAQREFTINDIPMPQRVRLTHPRPVSKIVCWHCKGSAGNRPLFNVRDEHGKKTKDYVCDVSKMLGFYKPTIGNQSEIRFQYAAN